MEGDKPGSVDRLAPARGHLSGTSVSRGLLRPTRNSCAAGRHWFLLGLASGGVYHAVPVSRKRGGLLPHRFTLACAPPPRRANTRHRRSVLCCTFRRLSTPGSYPAPCPVKPGLSSNGAPQGTRPRPPLPPMGPVWSVIRRRSTLVRPLGARLHHPSGLRWLQPFGCNLVEALPQIYVQCRIDE